MIPILPPELLYTILEFTALSHHDPTRVALTCRSFLSSARGSLYRSIVIHFDNGVGYGLLVPGQSSSVAWVHRQAHGGQATAKEHSTLFKNLLSNPLLSPLVRTLRIHDRFGASSEVNTALIGDALHGCSNLEALICSNWKRDPQQLAMIVAEVKRDRLRRGQVTSLKVHLEAATLSARNQTDPLDLPLSSFGAEDLDNRFAANYLASSTTSLRGLSVNLKYAHLYQYFPNISILSLHQHADFSLQDAQKLPTTALHFEHLNTLLWSSSVLRHKMAVLVWVLHRLPSTIQFLSLKNSFLLDQAVQLANALPGDTSLQQLNISGISSSPHAAQVDEVKDICRRKGVRLTIGEKWNVWHDLCTSSSHAHCIRSILTCSYLE